MGFIKDTVLGGGEKEAAKRESEAIQAGGEIQREAFREAGEIQSQYIGEASAGLAPVIRQAGETQADFERRAAETAAAGIRGAAQTEAYFAGRAGQARQQAGREAAGIFGQRFAESAAGLQPTLMQGRKSAEVEAALSGALGPEIQKEAFRQFQESPGIEFLRDQGLRHIESGLGATGKLGSGERLRELTKFSQGLALQDLGRQTKQLGEISRRGVDAGKFLGSLGAQTSVGQSQAVQAAGAGAAAGLGAEGLALGQGIRGSAGVLASGLSAQGQALTKAQLEEALAIARAKEAQGSALARGISGGGEAFGQAIQLTGAPQAQGVRGQAQFQNQKIADAVQAAVAASDERLKTNIKKIGVLESGLPWYKWDWNELGKKIAGGQRTVGVMAQEAMQKFPDAVSAGEDGFLRVNYARIS